MEIEKTPLVEIFNRMTKLDQQIDLKMIEEEKLCKQLYDIRQELAALIPEYEKLRTEVITRFPIMKDDDAFKSKVK